MIDINELKEKTNNPVNSQKIQERIEKGDLDPKNVLPAEQFIGKIIEPIIELQKKVTEIDKDMVKGVSQNNQTFSPDKNGIVVLPSAETVLSFKTNTQDNILSIDGSVKVGVQCISTRQSQATFETVNVDIQTASIGSNNFTTKGTVPVQSVGIDSTVFTVIDITQYLSPGEQQVKLSAVGVDTQSSAIILFQSITLASLGLTFATDWRVPQSNSMTLSYYISGAISKLLTIQVDGITIVNNTSLGTSVYTENPYTIEITDDSVLSHGVHSVRAWLAASSDTSKRTDVVEGEVFFNGNSDNTETFIAVNNFKTSVQPYVTTDIFEYCLFKNGSDSVPLVIRALTADESSVILEQDLGNVPTGERRTYTNFFSITSQETTIPLHMYFFTKDEEGNEINLLASNGYTVLTIDNSSNYAPTSMLSGGFILNPQLRSNSESNPMTIINALNGRVIESEWSKGIDLLNEGYIDGVLRIKAGHYINITGYDTTEQMRDPSSSQSLTMEFDVTIYNLQSYEAESEPVITVGNTHADGNVLGWQMFPLRAHMLTQKKRNINTQDIQWSEGNRQHITVNIINNVSGKGINYVRLFINGVMNREFKYENDVFASQNVPIALGSKTVDIDIHGIRIYKQALSSQDIQQDFKASLPTASEKEAFKNANDILGDDNTINISKCQSRGYNTLRWYADDMSKNLIPNYSNKGSNVTKGTLEMLVYKADGTLNFKYCRRITKLKQKGQGTSSMTYWMWNISYSPTDDSQVYVMDESGNWVLDESVSGADCYFLFPNGKSSRSDIKGLKNVAKLNWASSMQSHKMGWCNLYTDLWWQCIGNTAINNVSKYENCRKSVTQLPFFFFVGDENSCRFSNLMTFGPGKYDKLCWGTKAPSEHYIKDGKPSSIFTALEGSKNGRPLPERRVPWLTDEVFYYLNRSNDDDSLNETLVYNGVENFDVDKAIMNVYEEGTDQEYEIPKGFTPVANSSVLWQETKDTEFDAEDIYLTNGNTIKFFRRAHNHDYLHNPFLNFVSGTVETLRSRADSLNQDYLYWVTQSSGSNEAYDLFRWNPLTSTWVNAGAAHDPEQTDGYARLNLMAQCGQWLIDYNIAYKTNDPANLNNAFIQARIKHYKETSSLYNDENGYNFDQAFRKLGALKDNWCKNTYDSLQPNGLISPDSDDNDTSGDLDNVGASKCPYFAEEHDHCDEDGTFNPDGVKDYWNSQTSARWCLREMAYGEEISNMMQTMLNKMADMAGTAFACMNRYFFDASQRYFPATAYNEQGRLLYETAAVAMANGEYSNDTEPLSQNLGDHLQSEIEFWTKRIIYIGSWCRASNFVNDTAFSFRTGSRDAKYKFTVTAHQAIYPAIVVDRSVLTSITKHRMLPGETYAIDTFEAGTQDITVNLCGINYFTSIGDLSGMSIGSDTLTIQGKRLVSFKADGSDRNFSPGALVVAQAAERLQHVEVTNVPRISGNIDFSNSHNLVSLDLRGDTGVTSVTLPKTASLREIHLPQNLTSLDIEYMENIEAFTIDGLNNMETIKVVQSGDCVAHEILSVIQ